MAIAPAFEDVNTYVHPELCLGTDLVLRQKVKEVVGTYKDTDYNINLWSESLIHVLKFALQKATNYHTHEQSNQV